MQFIIDDNCLKIEGVVSVQTLTRQNYQQFEKYCTQPEIQAIDLAGVIRADSACISLLLNMLRQHSGSLQIINIPDSVRALVQLYEIQDWIHE